MSLKARGVGLFQHIQEDLAAAEELMYQALDGHDSRCREMAVHLLQSGGKRLRPALVVLCGRFGSRPGPAVVGMAAVVELLHMATLVHDDILDGARVRRGRPTLNARWGVHGSVLTGDLLFATSFGLLTQKCDASMVGPLCRVVTEMCRAEVEQAARAFDLERTEAEYLDHVSRKTALFISECCRLGALAAGAPQPVAARLGSYGYALGVGFQVIDDILDLAGNPGQMGKAAGTDLLGGVFTLPVIRALHHSPQSGALRALLGAGELDAGALHKVLELLHLSGSLRYSRRVAETYVERARREAAALPASPSRATLLAVADFVLARTA